MFTLGRIALAGGLVACSVSWACAAGSPPVLRADSNRLGVREGTRSWPGVWVVSADTALDTYDAQPSALARRITFYSGIDSLCFDAVPGQHYDFVIRLPDRYGSSHARLDAARGLAPRGIRAGGPAGRDAD